VKLFIELFQLPLSVCACGQSDGPVRVQMIHVSKRQERVQRSVNRCRHAILGKRRKRVIADHFVFVRFAAVEFLELFQTIKVQQGKSTFSDGPQVSATGLYCKHAYWLASKRIEKFQLCTRISAAE